MSMEKVSEKDRFLCKASVRRTLFEMRRHKTHYLFMVPYLLIFFTFVVLPVLIAMFFSLTYYNILEPPKLIWFENYRRLFIEDSVFLIAIKNTIMFAVITGPVSYFMCLFLAWLVSDLSPLSRTFLTLLFYAPSLCNIYYIWQLIFSSDSYGFLNAWLVRLGILAEPKQWLIDESTMVPVIILIVLWGSLGTGFLSFVAGFQNVDRTLYEAAAIDGVKNRWQELWFVTLPYMRPQLLFGAVMQITNSFGIGTVITALAGFPTTNYAAHTIMNHLEDYGSIRFEMGYACAVATILFAIMVASNKLVQKLIGKVGK